MLDRTLYRSPTIDRSQKASGAYYTPEGVAIELVRWAVRKSTDWLLDPSCGDGRFVAAHRNSVGVEQDATAAATAKQRAPWTTIHQGDFFAWAKHTDRRFDSAAGNPPFIRYQTFKGEVRKRALSLCASLGVEFSGLTASWAPFLVATAGLLRPGGRLAFVVPAAIGHAPYAAPLLDYFVEHFDDIHIVAIRHKLFPQLSEDCWLLFAEGFGGSTDEIRFTPLEQLQFPDVPPRHAVHLPVHEWRRVWNRRLRPYLLSDSARSLYQAVAKHMDSVRLGSVASIGIGYVSGSNEFFHLRPSEVNTWRIPNPFLYPTVRNSRVLPSRELTTQTVDAWRSSDEPMLLLRIPKDVDPPMSVLNYLDSEAGWQAREAYKCRTRKPWYSVPDVRVPDFFLTYMAGLSPNLVRNSAGVTCTNALHAVRVHDRHRVGEIHDAWCSRYVQLSCELEGHALGGGLLKLEPTEAARVVIPSARVVHRLPNSEIQNAVSTLRTWRHYA